jgi:hypothetical protein
MIYMLLHSILDSLDEQWEFKIHNKSHQENFGFWIRCF